MGFCQRCPLGMVWLRGCFLLSRCGFVPATCRLFFCLLLILVASVLKHVCLG